MVSPCYAGFIIDRHARATTVVIDTPSTAARPSLFERARQLGNKMVAKSIDTSASNAFTDISERVQRIRAQKAAKAVERAQRPKKSGIWGRLSFYLASLSVLFFIVTLCTLFTPFAGTAAGIALLSAMFALPTGIFGLFRRKKKGMAIAGLLIGLLGIMLVAVLISFVVSVGTAMAAALPFIGLIFLMGH